MNMQPGQSRQLEQRGFTLIELMIAAAIVAILATIAVPSYQKYQLKTNRPQGEQCLVEAQRRIEDAYAHLNQYPGADLSSYGYSTATTNCGDSKSLYTISLTWPGGYSAAANTYTLTATPVGTQVKDGTLTLTYNSQTLNPSQRLLKQHIPSGSSTAVASWDFQPGQ